MLLCLLVVGFFNCVSNFNLSMWSIRSFHSDSSQWSCLDSQRGENYNRSCFKWKQKYLCWQKIDWWAKSKWKREMVYSINRGIPSEILNFRYSWSTVYFLNFSLLFFFPLCYGQYFFIVGHYQNLIKKDIAAEKESSKS